MSLVPLSKVLMYEFYYDYIKNKYCNKSRLLFTDTDSLMYEIKSEDAYEDFSTDKDIFDFSNYSRKSKYYDNSKKLIVDKMKSEAACAGIFEFLLLEPNMYSFLVDDNS